MLLGLDVVSSGLRFAPTNLRLRQLQALALAGSGATAAAAQILCDLTVEEAGEEAMGILGRIYKDLWRSTGEDRYLALSSRTYIHAYEFAQHSQPIRLDGALYTGINAATTLFLLGDVEAARRIAKEVCTHCQAKLQATPDYWAEATLGEAGLLLGEFETAAGHYRCAAQAAKGNWRDLASMRRQAREILERTLGRSERTRLDDCFALGPVVVFSGHMIDTPQRLQTHPERFPARNVPAVATALREALFRIRPCGAYASGACGSDLIFWEVLQDLPDACSMCMVLPFCESEFVETSVAGGGQDWMARFRRTIDWVRNSGRIEQVAEHPLVGASASFDYANIILQGLATIQARSLDADVMGLAVWDGLAEDGPGGTGSAIARWLNAGLKVEVIHPGGSCLKEYSIPKVRKPAGESRIMALLFADVARYTSLTEQQIPKFRDHFLTTVADVLKKVDPPALKNTWGDAVYLVFEDVRNAAVFAVELQDAVAKKDWASVGLPADLSLRISLHAGPIYECINPITERKDYLGTHISRAARIEPKTMRGQIYCSQEFVALAHAMGVPDFTFEYVGRIELPKNFGIIPAYSVRRTVAALANRKEL